MLQYTMDYVALICLNDVPGSEVYKKGDTVHLSLDLFSSIDLAPLERVAKRWEAQGSKFK